MSLTLTPTNTNRLGGLLSKDAPPIVVSFSDAITDAEIVRARHAGLDIAELRVDRYSDTDPDHVEQQIERFSALPTIATIRTQAEGGEWTGSDAQREVLFNRILPHVDAIDIELVAAQSLEGVIATAHQLGKLVILSNHNFESTPSNDDLVGMTERAKAAGADLVKLSAMANSFADVQTLARFTVMHADDDVVVIAMGSRGTVSRVFFPALGSRLTYAHSGSWPVPGQLDFDRTFELLRLFYPDFNEKKIVELGLLENL